MGAITYQITNLTIVYSTVYSSVDQRKHQNSASLAFVGGGGGGIHRWLVNSPHKWPVTLKMFPFDDVIVNHDATVMSQEGHGVSNHRKLDRLFNSLFGPTTQSISKLRIISPLWRESSNIRWSTYKRPVMRKAFPCHNVTTKIYTDSTPSMSTI